jgi:hypothetical protein
MKRQKPFVGTWDEKWLDVPTFCGRVIVTNTIARLCDIKYKTIKQSFSNQKSRYIF